LRATATATWRARNATASVRIGLTTRSIKRLVVSGEW
jgi:hypothetical protein